MICRPWVQVFVNEAHGHVAEHLVEDVWVVIVMIERVQEQLAVFVLFCFVL